MKRLLFIVRAGAHVAVLTCVVFVATKEPVLGWVFLPVLLIGLPAMHWAQHRQQARPRLGTLLADPTWVYPFCALSAVLAFSVALFGGLRTHWPTPLPTEVKAAATDLHRGIIFKHTETGRRSVNRQIGMATSPQHPALFFACEEFDGFCESWQGAQRRGAIRTTLDPRGFLIPLEVLDDQGQVLVSQADQIRHINARRKDQQAIAWAGSVTLGACALLILLTVLPELFRRTR